MSARDLRAAVEAWDQKHAEFLASALRAEGASERARLASAASVYKKCADNLRALLAEHPAPEPPSGGDCAFGGAGDTNPSAGRAGEVTAEELAAHLAMSYGSHVSPPHGGKDWRAADAILARYDVRRRP